jgi:hypothetical protein
VNKSRLRNNATSFLISVGDPDPEDPHDFGLPDPEPDPLVRVTGPDPDASLFLKRC